MIEPIESETLARTVIELSSKNLIHNFNVIRELARTRDREQSLIPMIKANAYGHGMAWAAKHLGKLPGLYALGVATLEEGVQLRQELGLRFRKTPIMVFSGCMPFNDDIGQICENNNLTAVIASNEDWAAFVKGNWPGRISYELKFNTGMNRLGISIDRVSKIIKDLKTANPEAFPQGVLSHFAMSDQFEHPLTLNQVQKFKRIQSELASRFSQTHFHMANSGAVWNLKNMGLDTDSVRPGISLYGVPPWQGAPMRDLRPVMTLRAKVLMTRGLAQGETIGYNASYKVTTTPFQVAILGLGYGDGYHRALSNMGRVISGRDECPVVGIVSMDLTAVRCDSRVKVGSWVEVFGAELPVWQVAQAAGTIPYEVFTSLTSRVSRIYKDE